MLLIVVCVGTCVTALRNCVREHAKMIAAGICSGPTPLLIGWQRLRRKLHTPELAKWFTNGASVVR